MSVMRLQLEAVGLGHLWADGDLGRIADELARRRSFAGDSTAGGRAILLASGVTEFWRGDFATASELLGQVRVEADGRGDASAALLAGSVIAMIASFRGQVALADEEFDRVIDQACRVDAPAAEVMARSLRIAVGDATEWSLVVGEIERCRSILESLGRPDLVATVDLAEGWALASQGRFAEASMILARAADGTNAPLERSIAMLRRAEVMALDGRQHEARAEAVTAVDVFDSWQARYWSARAALLLASIEGDRGGRRVGAILADAPDDPAYTRLFEPSGSIVIDLRCDPVIVCNGEPLAFLTRHAEAAVRLLAAAGAAGMQIEDLTRLLWPDADPARVAQRFRTMLWQVRSGLGPESWRLQRQLGVVTMDLTGIEVTGRLDRKALAASFAARSSQTSSGSYSPRS